MMIMPDEMVCRMPGGLSGYLVLSGGVDVSGR